MRTVLALLATVLAAHAAFEPNPRVASLTKLRFPSKTPGGAPFEQHVLLMADKGACGSRVPLAHDPRPTHSRSTTTGPKAPLHSPGSAGFGRARKRRAVAHGRVVERGRRHVRHRADESAAPRLGSSDACP